jgi:hypothetical protein
MGTRGLVFIRCRGRYFIYYNHFDSYPDFLGTVIVSEIPKDPDQYRSKYPETFALKLSRREADVHLLAWCAWISLLRGLSHHRRLETR